MTDAAAELETVEPVGSAGSWRLLSFDVEIRKVICSTNAIESVNSRICKAVCARGHFPNEAAAIKRICMAPMGLDPTGKAASGGP